MFYPVIHRNWNVSTYRNGQVFTFFTIIIFFCPTLTIWSPIFYHELCRNCNVSAYRNGQVFAIFLQLLFSFAQLLLSGRQCFIWCFAGTVMHQPIEMGRHLQFFMIVIFFCPALTIRSPILYHELCRNCNVSTYRNGQVYASFLRSLFSFAQLLLSGHQCFIRCFAGTGMYQPIEMGRY
jgi:hypothetical protein